MDPGCHLGVISPSLFFFCAQGPITASSLGFIFSVVMDSFHLLLSESVIFGSDTLLSEIAPVGGLYSV